MLCFFKSLEDNDMYAAVRRSHQTTRLILLPEYNAPYGRRIAQSPGGQIYAVYPPGEPRILLCSKECFRLLDGVTIFEIHNSLHA